MVIMMVGVIFTEPEVSVDADADAELMLRWQIRLLCGLLKKVNNNERTMTPEVRAISAAKTDVDADAAAELSNTV